MYGSNPFMQKKGIDTSKLHIIVLRNHPNSNEIKQLKNLTLTNNDAFKIVDKSVYLYCPNSYGKIKLNNNLFEKKLNPSATTRNQKTITKLIELSN